MNNKDEIKALLAKALKTKEPVMYGGRKCFLKSLTYQDDLILSAIVQDVCLESMGAGMEEKITQRAASLASMLATVKLSLHDEETGEPVFKTMESINSAMLTDAESMKAIRELHSTYTDSLDLTKEEKKSS